MIGLSPWISVIAVVLAALTSSRLSTGPAPRVQHWLNTSWMPLVIGGLTGALVWYVWGSLTPSPVMHDESAYVLQAELFARLRWTGPPPPIPEFFEQLYVLVNPVLASKYPPGTSLVLAPGALVGLPGLPVIVMNAVSGALLFALVRRISGPAVALLTWLIWITSFPTLYFHATYLSEGPTSLAWIATFWGIARWDDESRTRWLVLAGAAIGFCIISRPLTGVALLLVAGAVVVWRCWSRRKWRGFVPAFVTGLLLTAVLPLWNWRTTGDVRLAPLTVYTKAYVPFDKPGFGVSAGDQPSSRLPHDQLITSTSFYQEHVKHTIPALPGIARDRLTMLDRDAWYEWRGGFRVLALLGLLVLPVAGWIGIAALLSQFLLYLSYAHPASWTTYYLELAPVPALLTALGIVRVLTLVAFRAAAAPAEGAQQSASTAARLRHWWRLLRAPSRSSDIGRRLAGGLTVFVAVMTVPGVMTMRAARAAIASDHAYYDSFASQLRRIRDQRAIVFVRYAPHHIDGLSLVRNEPALNDARVWVVYDRGAENERLMRIAPDRATYLFDEGSWLLRRAPHSPLRSE